MNRKALTVAAFALSGLVGFNVPAQAGAEHYDITLPIYGLNNPCTGFADGIDGSIDLKITTQHSNGVHFLHVNGTGKAEDDWGLKYNLKLIKHFQFHDPLPATVFIRKHLVSQGSVDNAFITFALHVNEQGVVTKAEFSGIDCRG
jgi:hypothetical protein